MTAIQDRIDALKSRVRAADEEFRLTQRLHETWKPAAFDDDLHKRMGQSFASNTFLTIRTSLRREMLMSLMRIWDRDKSTVAMFQMVDKLSGDGVVDALVAQREAGWGYVDPSHASAFPDTEREGILQIMREQELEHARTQGSKCRDQIAEVVTLITRYNSDGARCSTWTAIKGLRDWRLAHHHRSKQKVKFDIADNAIEEFYSDTARLIELLRLTVENVGYDVDGAAEQHARHAKMFWASAMGERTEGHPNFQQQPNR